MVCKISLIPAPVIGVCLLIFCVLLLTTVLLISPWLDLEGNKLIFLSEWREIPSAPCLAGKKKLDDSSRLDVVEISRVPDIFPSLFPSWSG